MTKRLETKWQGFRQQVLPELPEDSNAMVWLKRAFIAGALATLSELSDGGDTAHEEMISEIQHYAASEATELHLSPRGNA